MPYKKDSNRCEVLLYNNVDTDLQDMLRPLNFIQTIYLSPKYTIKDGYITPNSLFCNILSAAGAIVFFSICVYRILTASKIGTFEGFSTTLLITKYFDAILFSLGFVANAYVSIRLSHLNVLLYLKLQAIKTFVPCKKIMQKVKYYSIVLIIGLIIVRLIMYIHFHWSLGYLSYLDLITDLGVISFDLNLVYASSIVKFLGYNLEELNKEILRIDEIKATMDEEGSKPDWNGIRRTYLKFSEAYNYFKDAFRILVRV